MVLLVLVMLAGRGLRRRAGLGASPLLELAVGAMCVAWFLPGDVWNGHFAEVAVPALWMLAGVQMRNGRVAAAGALLGLSAGFEPWGVLAAPLLLLDLRLRALLVGGSVFAAIVALLYLPFALTGHFALFDHEWPLDDGTLAHLLWPHDEIFSWYMRAAQGAVSVATCAAVVLLLRRRRGDLAVVWLAPTAAVLSRDLLDLQMSPRDPVCEHSQH